MMSQARYSAIYQGMTSAARKVCDVVPIAEPWDKARIGRELRRLGVYLDGRVFDACLSALRDAGLIRELRLGEFQREKVREDGAKPGKINETEETMSTQSPPVAATEKASPLDRLGELAARAARLSGMVNALASDISDAAIDIQAQLENTEEGVKKLRQLQTLLKSLGGE